MSARFREGAFYDVISNRPSSAETSRYLESFDNNVKKRAFEHFRGYRDTESVRKQACEREKLARSRSLNRISFERFREVESRGFDIINNSEYNPAFSKPQSTHYPPRVKPLPRHGFG